MFQVKVSSSNDSPITNTAIEQTSSATMDDSIPTSSKRLSSKIYSPLSRYGMLYALSYLYLWSVTVVSGFNAGLPYETSRAASRSSLSSSLIVMEAVHRKPKFKRLRKRLFSRTRRNYINDNPLASVDEGEAGIAIATTTKTDARETLTQDEVCKPEKIDKTIQGIRKAKQIKKVRVLRLPLKKRRKKEKETVMIDTVEGLRHAILDQELSLSDTKITEREIDVDNPNAASKNSEGLESPPLIDHAVRNLIKERFLGRSTPGNRHGGDNATLAIAIEGGGMRGCVSAGMVAAITALGLSDAIDTIYGSSAGSVVGAYMVSRQVCMDVYVDILPASKERFVCKKRMVRNLASLGLGRMLSSNSDKKKQRAKNYKNMYIRPSLSPLKKRLSNTQPGMNISFVLDGILSEDHGLRPLDIDAFRENNKHQKLRVVSSCVDPHTGKLYSRCFGSDDFFDEDKTMVRADREREGLFACLQASMTVPGATGPPVNLMRKSSIRKSNNSTSAIVEDPPLPCFDAFCFEPIPYRSAVEEGATHVLVLASRPEDYMPKTKQGIYETRIAPLYFNSHGQRKVSEFFERGGQQYLYAEDLMLLQEAKYENHEEGVLVPPPEILYGVERTEDVTKSIRDREEGWNRAHLFPLRVPKGYKELETLEQDKDAVLEAVRDGFMTAFDALSDIVGLDAYEGKDVAELVFPSSDDGDVTAPKSSGGKASPSSKSASSISSTDQEILRTPVRVPGEPIPRYGPSSIENDESDTFLKPRRRLWRIRRMIRRRSRRRGLFGHGSHDDGETTMGGPPRQETRPKENRILLEHEEFSASTLLKCLPGFQDGRFGHLAKGLREQQMQQQEDEIRRSMGA